MHRTIARRLVTCCGLVVALCAGAPLAGADPEEPVCEWVTPSPPETTTTTTTTTTEIPATTTETTTTTTEPAIEPIWVCETETPPVSVAAVPTIPPETVTATGAAPAAAETTSISSTSPAVSSRSSNTVATTTIPRSSTSQSATTVSSAPSVPLATAPIAAPAKSAAPAAASLLTISAGSPLSGPATVTPGQTWTGTMNLSVTNVSLLEGWVSTVSLSPIIGKNTGTVVTPTSATYSAPATNCAVVVGTSAAVHVNLTSTPANAKRGIAVCLTSWAATVSIGVPATGVVADTYEATLTHSIY
ncbi:MAG: hypothetical protein C0482_19390 [Gordonia sp.]|nr:hypothetical protein [Gordonia sp. (in: high G+C Gram-positive bacteria)]